MVTFARTAPHGTTISGDRLASLAARSVTLDLRPVVEVESPLTGRVVGTVPHATEADVAHAVDRARAAQPAWAGMPLAQRSAVLRRLARRVLDGRDEVLDLVQLESGKARSDALEEVLDVASVATYYAGSAATHLAPRRRRGAVPLLTRTTEHHHPKGVIGIIAPWNYPLSLTAGDALPALVAGNAVVLKPDKATPFTGLWVAEQLAAAGLPDGVLQVITGPGRDLGTPLIERVDHLMFTGSTATGRIVAEQAGRRLIGSSMELGGKNALLVLDDADLDRAVPGAVRACFANSGQLCISAERVLVHAAVWDRFVPRFAEAAGDLRIATDVGWEGDVGPLASAEQLDTVRRHLDDAVARGATVLAGGSHRPDLGPYAMEPTVLTGITPDMELASEETFGPVVALVRVADDDDAIARANDSPYGLSFSVWTADRRRGERIAIRLRAGSVNVNDAYAAAWASTDAPMGGMKDSGLGRRHGAEGILEYTEPQTVAVQRLAPLARPGRLAPERWAAITTALLRLLPYVPTRRWWPVGRRRARR